MKKITKWFLNPPVKGQSTILIIRLMAGSVFFWEGILKFVYANQGVGRFTKLGFPFPETTAHLIATGEIIGGLLLIFGLFTRITAFYFIVQMIVAVLSTKIDLYFGRSPLPMPPAPPKMGIWAVLHEIRSDYAQILTSLFLLIEGAGRKSLDSVVAITRKKSRLADPSVRIVNKRPSPQKPFLQSFRTQCSDRISLGRLPNLIAHRKQSHDQQPQ
jgi:putative oxidoreductase